MHTTPAVHRCLTVKELTRRIVLHCRDSHATLAVLARTHTYFSDVALDQLWSVQQGFRNLLRCLPDGLWRDAPRDLVCCSVCKFAPH